MSLKRRRNNSDEIGIGEETPARQEQISAAVSSTAPSSSLLLQESNNNDLLGDVDDDDESPLPPPEELQNVDFTTRIHWGKCQPYSNVPLPLTPEGVNPAFLPDSPALCHYVHAMSHRARAGTIHVRRQPGQQGPAPPIPTPMFMPVGTKGCLKGVSFFELTADPALACPIVLGNTYHLALQPGSDLVDEMGGLHAFQGRGTVVLPDVVDHTTGAMTARNGVNDDEDDTALHHFHHPPPRTSYNLLTDSGGFQMVSLAKLSKVTERGVVFANPFKQRPPTQPPQPHKFSEPNNNNNNNNNNNEINNSNPPQGDLLLLKPEDSIQHQNNLSANIIMALDDVVSSVENDPARFELATHRTLRWYDRCYRAHAKKETQNLFPIVQGGLDVALGGLREQCLAGFRHRQVELQYQTPGYAIGGLAGGESKDQFWRVVDQCCKALPDDKPRYLMGVGYPLDLVVCTALGIDLYDCVYPTRTARFGVCLVPGRAPGTLKLKNRECTTDTSVIQNGCQCQACRLGVSRARLHSLLKTGNPLAVSLVTQHNVAYMMNLVRSMRRAILQNTFAEYAREFVRDQFPGKDQGGEDPPLWVVEALSAAGITV